MVAKFSINKQFAAGVLRQIDLMRFITNHIELLSTFFATNYVIDSNRLTYLTLPFSLYFNLSLARFGAQTVMLFEVLFAQVSSSAVAGMRIDTLYFLRSTPFVFDTALLT